MPVDRDAGGAFEVRTVRGDGLDLAVDLRIAHDRTSRRGVLALHGWPGTRADWRPVLDRLADDPRFDDAHLLAPDLRGFGESGRPEPDAMADSPYLAFGPAAHGGDVDALLDGLELDQVIVAGYDLGANLAQALARRQPGRVAGLVLFDPVHPAALAQVGRLGQAELWYQHFHCLEWSDQLVGQSRSGVELYLRHFYRHWWGNGAVTEDHFQALVDRYARPGAFRASIGWYRVRAAGRAHEAAAAAGMASLDAPVEVVWGEADPITPVFFAGSVGESFTDVRLTVVPGAGHFGPLECPDELAAAFVRLADRVSWRR